MADRDDRDLVLAFQAGDRKVFEELYRRHAPRVRSVCLRFLRDPRDAEEAAQEAFLRAYMALPRFNGRFRVGPWLARIAANVCLDQLRAKSRTPVRVALGPEHEPLVRQDGPERLLVGDEPRLESALATLAPLHATALRLRAQGLSHREIGRRLGTTPQQAKALLHRARTSAKRAWQGASARALVPLIHLRAWLVGRGLAPGFELAPAGAGFGPLAAERAVMAGAAFLLALTPATPAEQPRRQPAPLQPPALVTEDATGTLAPLGTAAPATESTPRPAGEAQPAVKRDPGVLEQLFAAVERPRTQQPPRPREQGGRHGDEPPGDPSSTSAEKFKEGVERTLEELLPRGG